MKRMLGFLNIGVAVLFFAMAMGCSTGARLTPPGGFATLTHTDDYSYRATNASGVVIGVHTEKNEPSGNLEFWTYALDNKMRSLGYVALEQAPLPVKSDNGAEGNRLRYETMKNGRKHEYWLNVFVVGDQVIVVEVAGDEAYFDAKVRDDVDVAVRTLTLG